MNVQSDIGLLISKFEFDSWTILVILCTGNEFMHKFEIYNYEEAFLVYLLGSKI